MTARLKKGDLVKKASGTDRDQIGIILKYEVNPVHNELVTVMTDRGIIKAWYAKLVKKV